MTPGLSAAEFAPQPGLRNLSIDLDTFSGSFSVWETKDLCGLNAVRGEVVVSRLGEDERWAPAVTISIKRGNEMAGLRLTSANRQRPFALEFLSPDAGAPGGGSPHGALFDLDKPTPFAMEWTPDGRATVHFGDAVGVVKLSGPPEKVAFGDSTAEATFDPVTFGHIGPAPVCSAKP